ncbi:MAG: hypothetical protein LPK08_04875 [Halomonas sp.]|uniref:Uncharacterized protein n=1 Tax=Billgrantia antri TaxID=2846777 RepID=A0ABS6ZL56_9GAMM|nr:hypothetical protein [Halomonas antri]MBW6390794.1 hypothetical protein [Halomonas antri]MDX5376842.1 hypothetical protein [Halomonas sp.]
MATEAVGAPGGNDLSSTDQQAFDAAIENAQAQAIVGQAVGSLAMMHLMDYAGDMLKDEG